METWTGYVITAASSAIVAALGAVLGFRFALEKSRRERGFEMQVRWYEQTAQKLSASGVLLAASSTFESLYKESSGYKSSNHVLTLFPYVMRMYQEAELYASPKAYRAFNPLLNAIHDLTILAGAKDAERKQETLEAIHASSYLFGELASLLIDEARTLLGLGKLKRGWTWDRKANRRRLDVRREAESLVEQREAENWSRVDLKIIKNILSRYDHAASSSELVRLVAQLREYADTLEAEAQVPMR
jgi:hypothetical protein